MKIGDKVILTPKFLREGEKLFGKDFSRPKNDKHIFEIVKILEWGSDGEKKQLATVKLNGYKPKHWVKVGKGMAEIHAGFLQVINN